MSDYLGALVDRTLGFAPVVQPRLRAMHEPAPRAEEAAPLAEATEWPSPVAEPPRRVAERAPTETPADPRAASTAPPRAREVPAPEPAQGPTTESGHAWLVPREIVVTPRRRVDVDHAPAPLPAAFREAIKPAAERRASETSPPPAFPCSVEAAPPAPRKFPGAEDAAVPIPRVRDPERAPAAPTPAAAAVSASRIRPRTTQPALSAPVAPHRRDSGPEVRRDSPGPAPAIHVTIGRVEVRAVVDSRASPRRAAPASRQLLEDYLKTRDAGKARP